MREIQQLRAERLMGSDAIRAPQQAKRVDFAELFTERLAKTVGWSFLRFWHASCNSRIRAAVQSSV